MKNPFERKSLNIAFRKLYRGDSPRIETEYRRIYVKHRQMLKAASKINRYRRRNANKAIKTKRSQVRFNNYPPEFLLTERLRLSLYTSRS